MRIVRYCRKLSLSTRRLESFPQPEWPTLSGETGVPREGNAAGYQCDGSDGGETCSWLALELLAEHGGLESTATITSAETTLNVGATNAPSGNYGWYLGHGRTGGIRAGL